MMSEMLRDVKCGVDFGKLYDLGCFEEEYAFYGYGYCKDGKTIYAVSADGEKIYRERRQMIEARLSTSPVLKRIYHTMAGSGESDEIKRKLKIQLLLELRTAYSDEYFYDKKICTKNVSDTKTDEMLQRILDKTDGYFPKTEIDKFAALCSLAYANYKLTKEDYGKYKNWLKHAYKQIESETVEKDKFKRKFYGIGYLQDDELKYFYDAKIINVYQKNDELTNLGIFTTPIMSKEYNFSSLNQLADIRQDFAKFLAAQLDREYCEQLKLVAKKLSFEKCCSNVSK